MNIGIFKNKHFIVLLSACMMVGASIGLLINGNGLFYRPMATDLGLLQGSVALHGTFLSLSTAFTSLTINSMIERFGWKKCLTFGVTLGVCGTMLMALVNNIFLLYLFGIIRGIGTAFFSMVPMNILINHWFHKKNGVAIGMASGTSGIVGAFAAPILAYLIETFGWRLSFLILGFFILLFAAPILLVPYELDPRDEGLMPYGARKRDAKDGPVVRSRSDEFSPTDLTFIALIVIALLNTMIVFINPHMPAYGQSIGLRPEVASLMLSAVMIGNLVSKLSFGFLSEKFGPVKTALGMSGVSVLSLVLLIFFRQPVILIIASLLFGSIFSVGGVGLPLLTNTFYDPKTASQVYSKVSFTATFGGALSVSLVGYIYDFTGSYIPAFVIAILFNLINAVMLITSYRSHLQKQAA